MEKERDFYFGKLREIELLCQEHGQENDDLVQRLMEVLYASDEHVSVRRALDCCVLKRRSWSGCSDQCAFGCCPGILRVRTQPMYLFVMPRGVSIIILTIRWPVLVGCAFMNSSGKTWVDGGGGEEED